LLLLGLKYDAQKNEKLFSNPKTVQLFNRFATYNGSNPSKSCLTEYFSHLEFNLGAYLPKRYASNYNTFGKLAEEANVEIKYTNVETLYVESNNKISLKVMVSAIRLIL
jgi:phytoene dehydrogenase-like protein